MTASPSASSAVLPLSRIRPSDNPRRYFDQKKHEELVASIAAHGMLQPLLVRPAPDADDLFTIVAGGRRHRAALEAFGPEGEVPVLIRDMSDEDALLAAIAENDDRDDASETEQADAAVRVLAACDGDRAEAARLLAWSTAKLDRRLALAKLSDAVKRALDERRIKVGHAELLAAVPADKQDKALETILSAGLGVSKTRELLMRVTQSLAAARFDTAECATCSYNSALQCALFATHVDAGHCTNTPCFELKSEAAEATREASSNSGAASDENTPVAVPGQAHPSTPRSGQGTDGAQPTAVSRAAATKLDAPAKKPAVTAKSLSARTADHRETVWRLALSDGLNESAALSPQIAAALAGVVKVAARDRLDFDHVSKLARGLNIDLRDSWQVDESFLGRLNKDELKFVAKECGLVAHMGEKAFAQLLGRKPAEIVAGMLHAKGFDWAGRLPSAVTLDGAYGPPPAAEEPESEPVAEPEES